MEFFLKSGDSDNGVQVLDFLDEIREDLRKWEKKMEEDESLLDLQQVKRDLISYASWLQNFIDKVAKE